MTGRERDDSVRIECGESAGAADHPDGRVVEVEEVIVEHWDATQDVPDSSANDNTMF